MSDTFHRFMDANPEIGGSAFLNLPGGATISGTILEIRPDERKVVLATATGGRTVELPEEDEPSSEAAPEVQQ